MRIYFTLCLLFFCVQSTLTNIPPIHHEDFAHSSQNISLQSEFRQLPSFFSEMYHDVKGAFIDLVKIIIQIPSDIFNHLMDEHLHSNEHATVRITENDSLNNQEKQFLHQRTEFVKPHIQSFTDLHFTTTYTPRIALCFSGGGFRAMLLTLGFLQGADEIGLLDSVTYTAGLSGSTWALAPWIASKKTISDYTQSIPTKLACNLCPVAAPWALKHVLETCVEKIAYKQIISTMDLYGAVLANTLLSEYKQDRFDIGFGKAHEHLNSTYPFPIYSAIIGNRYPYEWIEVTPYELGSAALKGYIPTWAYGRRFDNGISTDTAPDQTLGYYLAIFGSAFQANFDDLVRHTAGNVEKLVSFIPETFRPPLQTLLTEFIDGSPASDVRLLPSMLRNFTYQYPGCPYTTEKYLQLIDAGIDFNIPIPPLLRPERNIDIIIVYDASASFESATEFERALNYCAQKGHIYPEVDYTHVRKQHMNIFWDKNNSNTPIIIYFPMIKNEAYNAEFDPQLCTESDYCSTFNMQYTQQQAKELSGLSYYTIKQYSTELKTVLQEIIMHKEQLYA